MDMQLELALLKIAHLSRIVRQLEAELAGVRKDYDRLLRGAQPLVPDPVDFEGFGLNKAGA